MHTMGVRALPASNLPLSLISLFLFLSPVGLYAVALAVRSNRVAVAGNSAAARRLGEEARKWSIVGIISNVVMVLICTGIYLIFFRSTLDTERSY